MLNDVFLIINLIILLGKWFLNSRKSSERPVIFSEFVKMLKDKLESIRVSHTLKNDLEAFNSKLEIYLATCIHSQNRRVSVHICADVVLLFYLV